MTLASLLFPNLKQRLGYQSMYSKGSTFQIMYTISYDFCNFHNFYDKMISQGSTMSLKL